MERLNKKIILQKISDNKDKIKEFGVKNISLFGSYLREEQTKESDIDFLVEFEENRGGYKDKVKLLIFLEELFNKEIDICQKGYIREELKKYINEEIAVRCEI